MLTVAFEVRYCPDVDPQVVVDKIVFNPNYGGRGCSVPGTCVVRHTERAMKPKFFAALEKNVKRDGFRNPILLYNTPEGILLAFGGSRLRVARKLDKPIPAIVVDYTCHDYALWEEVTPDNWQKFFKDVPLHFEFTDVGVETHYSLERNRRHTYDPKGMEWAEGEEFIAEEFSWLSET